MCSRTQAAEWIRAGRVRVDGRTVRDPEFPTIAGTHRIAVDGTDLDVAAGTRRYLMLNKPRGLVTTLRDEQGRETVYRCFDGTGLGWIAPVGRLDKASEGLLLFSNDPQWAARVISPDSGPDKTYHVQTDRRPGDAELQAMCSGVECEGVVLRAKSAGLLRAGDKTAWLEIVLDEGRNRQIRRLLSSMDIGVLRLVRVAIGPVALGDLAKGAWRPLTPAEVEGLLATDGHG